MVPTLHERFRAIPTEVGRLRKKMLLFVRSECRGCCSQQFADDLALVFTEADRKSTRLNSSHMSISYAVFCLKKKKIISTNLGKFYHNSELLHLLLPKCSHSS